MVDAYTNETKENGVTVDELPTMTMEKECEPSEVALSFIEHFAHSLYTVGAEQGLKGLVISLN